VTLLTNRLNWLRALRASLTDKLIDMADVVKLIDDEAGRKAKAA
jgi:hypothetical protein